ncbi:DUF3231 family protein [Bacillus sp. MUM 13]|uniref:DUF3231 family protein n=1 Tax=Bacillus sp. MUM 13 TaxID=1678001 RepID=UPI0008F55C8E|nr:DUF3231 family protein [Bacillus sp. MUM 13]OIK13342.1 hypothetical protein BIV59_06180 [Bacillus sp. MUM 13]
MHKQNKMSSAELGILWMTYHKKTMILRMVEYFIEKSDDQKAKALMQGMVKKLNPAVDEITIMLQNDGAAVPIGFTKEDVNLEAPKLYEHGFDIMFCRILKEISMGMYVLHTTLSYREDIIMFYKKLTDITQNYYNLFTQYLLENRLLPTPNYTEMPKSNEYITDSSYMKGTNLFGHKRPLNTVEFGLLFHSLETNITGMQLMKSFAQCATDAEAKKYFTKGKNLTKEIIKGTENILLENNIHPAATTGGEVTTSTIAPFSDKMMLFCTNLLGGFSLGSQGFANAFVLRNDIIAKSAIYAKDVYEFGLEGAKLMMSKGWMAEPPKMNS